MRDFKGMKRQRGRNRKPGGGGGNANAANPNRSWDSQGPENIKVRGNAQTVYERYQQLARDAGSSGDRVLAENYLQHAEHYFRVLRALQPQRPVSEIAARELSNQGYDIDFEDETGAQAAAFLAAQQAADRIQQQSDARDAEAAQGAQQPREQREWTPRPPREENQNRDGQNRDREWTPRPPRDNQNRDNQARDNQDGQPRAEGEGHGEGGRRETRRERWERRREERNKRYEAEGGTPDTRTYEEAEGGRSEGGRYEGGRSDNARSENVREGGDFIASTAPVTYTPPADAPVEAAPEQAERPARRTRTPRAEAPVDTAQALPGFLTRSAAPATAPTPVASDDGEAPAPKRRAPRKKAETAADGE
jgi:hypothetical protein